MKFNRIHSDFECLFSFLLGRVSIKIVLSDLSFNVVEKLVGFYKDLAKYFESAFVDCQQFLFILEEFLEKCLDLIRVELRDNYFEKLIKFRKVGL